MTKRKRRTKKYYKKRVLSKIIPYILLLFFIPSREQAIAEVMRQNGDFIWANIMDFLVFAGGIGLIFDWFYDLKKSL